ncbi:outer membrane protein [Rhizorhabdus dicambivorans]|uniref:Porin family protein n=1 Tax=Rhizorhabdus dicambivorans TaxID=1850238 RepID=A0A2A4G0C0_9SPHN|nr:outer membrane beta-barrel protein [Rhizorhabdus dicambivorans]ATE63228.1 porin family protein [Rhizorhabdus dicambivorans]PCE43441.1 porin family protein [Rhizorhabdus dicambivorans]
MKYLVAAALVAAGLSAPASAADDSVTYRIEAHGGWDRVTVGGGGEDGALYGIGIGIDIPVSATAFIGFEGNADLSSVKECVSFTNPPFFGRVCDQAKRDLSAVARLGANIGGGLKLYVLGGYTNARIRETSTVIFGGFGGPITTVTSGSANGDGWRAGAGAEVKLGGSAYTKLEYRYSNYEGGFQRHQIVAGLGLGL